LLSTSLLWGWGCWGIQALIKPSMRITGHIPPSDLSTAMKTHNSEPIWPDYTWAFVDDLVSKVPSGPMSDCKI
jgi:hypothetical protein